MNVFDLTAKIGLDKSAFTSGLKSAGQLALQTAGQIGGAMLDFASSSVEAGMSFDSSMSQVAATMGTTVDEISDLREFAQEMGRTTSFSATESADALNYMALAGYDAKTSMEMLPTVLNLAAAGGIDLAYASDMVTDAQSALGLSTEEAAQMVDQMAKASSKSNTSVEQLGEAMLTIGATARNVKGGTQELSTVLGVLADNGIKGAEGGTHLRNIMLSLQNPTKTAQKTLNELGISVYDADGNMRSMIDVVGDLQNATAGMDQASKDAIVSGIFNKTDLASVNALLGTSKERFEELGNAISDSSGAAKDMADTQLDNLEGNVTLFKSALEGAQIAISDELSPTLNEFVKFGSEGLSKITEGFKEGGFSGAMDAFGEVLTDGINLIDEVLPEILEMAGELISALSQGIIDNLPTIVSAISNILPTIIDFIVEALPTIIDAGVQILLALITGIAQALPKIIPQIVQVITKIVEVLIKNLPLLLQAALEIIKGLAVGLINALPVLMEALPEILNAIITFIVESIPLIVDMIPQIIEAVITAVLEAIPQIVEAGIQLLVSLIDALPQIIDVIVEAIPKIIDGIITALIDNIDKIIEAGVQLFVALVENMPKILAGIVKAIPRIITGIVEAVSKGIAKLAEAGLHLIEGLWQGISDSAKWLWEKVSGWLDGLWNGILDFFGIHSPSRKMAWVGKMLPKGLANGIDDSADEAVDAMQDMADDIADVDFVTSSVDIPTINNGNRYSIPSSNVVPSYAYAGTSGSFNTDDIITTIAGAVNQAVGNISISLYIGQTKFDDMVVQSIQRYNYKSGGR